MDTKPEVEHLARVWVDGHCVEVGDFEAPDFLELRTTGKNSEHFGPINLCMSPAFARELGTILVQLADIKQSK